ncbi:MAG: sirohydrochlorin cobaltochelatase, partial [Eubacteriaceae bacterium]|nr:sirohydrochlorin cobaltochelatase [Eubacteriaceae bacterium]
MEKTALLVVSFGTSYPETLAKTIAAIETELQTAFPEADLFRAFTSKKITAKLQKRDGVTVDSPGSAMKKIVAAGY